MKKKKQKNSSGAEALRAYLDISEITVRELAEKCGLSFQVVYGHLSGKFRIGEKAAKRYREKLGISYDKLLG